MFTDGHDIDTTKFEKVKAQNSVGLKCKFYRAMLKYLHFGEASASQQTWTAGIILNSRGVFLPAITTLSRDFDKYLYLKTRTLSCADE